MKKTLITAIILIAFLSCKNTKAIHLLPDKFIYNDITLNLTHDIDSINNYESIIIETEYKLSRENIVNICKRDFLESKTILFTLTGLNNPDDDRLYDIFYCHVDNGSFINYNEDFPDTALDCILELMNNQIDVLKDIQVNRNDFFDIGEIYRPLIKSVTLYDLLDNGNFDFLPNDSILEYRKKLKEKHVKYYPLMREMFYNYLYAELWKENYHIKPDYKMLDIYNDSFIDISNVNEFMETYMEYFGHLRYSELNFYDADGNFIIDIEFTEIPDDSICLLKDIDKKIRLNRY